MRSFGIMKLESTSGRSGKSGLFGNGHSTSAVALAVALTTFAVLSLPAAAQDNQYSQQEMQASPQQRQSSVNLSSGVDGNVHVRTISYRDIPFRTVVRQQFDFSCGSAALATLLTYHFERPITEQD